MWLRKRRAEYGICELCATPLRKSGGCGMKCGHKICRDCIATHCHSKLADLDTYASGIRCPGTGCSHTLHRDQLKRVLNPEDLAVHDERLQAFAQALERERSPIGTWIGRFVGRATAQA